MRSVVHPFTVDLDDGCELYLITFRNEDQVVFSPQRKNTGEITAREIVFL